MAHSEHLNGGEIGGGDIRGKDSVNLPLKKFGHMLKMGQARSTIEIGVFKT